MFNRTSLIMESIAYFLVGAIALYVAVQFGIPFLLGRYGVPPLIGWWIASGVIVIGLFVAAILNAHRLSNAQTVKELLLTLNVHRPDGKDFAWAVGGLIGVIILTGLVVVAANRIFSLNLLSQDSYASFLRMEKLKPSEYWLFLIWLPYFFFNIVGEELLWRGYLLPLQVHAIGRSAWILNGLLWGVFHIGIGWRIAILLLPIELVVPYVVQKRQNTWLGILIHGLFNGSAFVMVALGIVG